MSFWEDGCILAKHSCSHFFQRLKQFLFLLICNIDRSTKLYYVFWVFFVFYWFLTIYYIITSWCWYKTKFNSMFTNTKTQRRKRTCEGKKESITLFVSLHFIWRKTCTYMPNVFRMKCVVCSLNHYLPGKCNHACLPHTKKCDNICFPKSLLIQT